MQGCLCLTALGFLQAPEQSPQPLISLLLLSPMFTFPIRWQQRPSLSLRDQQISVFPILLRSQEWPVFLSALLFNYAKVEFLLV